MGTAGRTDDFIVAGRESGIERSTEYPQRKWTIERAFGMVDCWCPREEDGGWIGRAVF